MKKLLLLLTLLFLMSLQLKAIEITNFKSGLVCSDGQELLGVCFQTEDIYVTGQGTCIWSGEYKPCTWYGFSFDYKTDEDETELSCNYKTSQNIIDGNPKEIISKSTNHREFNLPLKGKTGHFFNPQYFLYNGYLSKKDSLVTSVIACSYKGKELFKYKINAHFPVK